MIVLREHGGKSYEDLTAVNKGSSCIVYHEKYDNIDAIYAM